MHVYLITENEDFPNVELANNDPNGLLATGGDLGHKRLVRAYSQGIFPWYSEGEPILWWCPNPRSVLFPNNLKISKSLRKSLKKETLSVTTDRSFAQVIRACAEPRNGDPNTWINSEMILAYENLYQLGYAHSIEAWNRDQLVAGLYGVAIGHVFFGESMFTRVSNGSKIAFVTLVKHLKKWGYQLIDCQIKSEHLDSLGATDITRQDFTGLLTKLCSSCHPGYWNKESFLTNINQMEE